MQTVLNANIIDHRVLVLGTCTCVVERRNVYFRLVDQEEALREGI